LLLSVLLVSSGLLTKALTAYIFYGHRCIRIAVVATRYAQLSASTALFACVLLALVLPLVWFTTVSNNGNSSLIAERDNAQTFGTRLPSYFIHLASFLLRRLFAFRLRC